MHFCTTLQMLYVHNRKKNDNSTSTFSAKAVIALIKEKVPQYQVTSLENACTVLL